MAMLLAGPLLAQDGLAYQFNLRAIAAGGTLQDLGSDRSGGGGGFALVIGEEPMRLRVRMDGDTFPGRTSTGPVSTYGFGVEPIVILPSSYVFAPYVSAGLAFQQWKLGPPATDPSTRDLVTNKLAMRVEFGTVYKEHLTICIGVLEGYLLTGRKASCPYLGISYMK